MHALTLHPAIVIILVTLAAARTFRLLAFDTITQKLRDYLEVYVFTRSAFLKEGFECPACAGFWYTLGWTATALAWSDTLLWQLAAISFAANYLVILFNALLDVTHETAEDLLNDDE